MTRERTLWLPDLCRLEPVLVIVLGAELVALVIVLASPLDADPGLWKRVGPVSLYVQWLALSCTVCLCVLRRWLVQLPIAASGLASWALCVLVCFSAALAVSSLDPMLAWAPQFDASEKTRFIFNSTAMSGLVAAAGLRYAFVHNQWRLQVEAKARAEADALQARIRPHFLFNSLNTIAALISSNAYAAEEATLDLADLFRASLKAGEEMIDLQQELELTQRYLSIEGLRLGERLRLTWEVDPPAGLSIPPLILQPLVENAIYHGLQQLVDGGQMRVRSSLVGQQWQIEVHNDAPPAALDRHRGMGMAQDYIRARLRQCFGDRADLVINRGDDYYCAQLRLPYTEAADQEKASKSPGRKR